MNYCLQCKIGRKFEYIKLNSEERMPTWKVAELAGVHENTVYNWLAAYRKGGFKALADESTTPKNHSNEYSDEIKGWIRQIRVQSLRKEKRHLGEGVIAHRLARDCGIKVSHSGIGKFMQRDGLIPVHDPGTKFRGFGFNSSNGLTPVAFL